MKGYEIVLYFVAQKAMKQRRHAISWVFNNFTLGMRFIIKAKVVAGE